MTQKKPICDYDCFNCKYPDCIAQNNIPDYRIKKNPPKTSVEKREQLKLYYKQNMEQYAESQAILAKARKAVGLTQQDLAVALGVSSVHIYHLEKGRSRADVPAMLDLIAKLAHIDVETLMEMVK